MEHREDFEIMVKKELDLECPDRASALVHGESGARGHACGYSEC